MRLPSALKRRLRQLDLERRRLRFPARTRRAWRFVRHQHLTYCTDRQLVQIVDAVRRFEASGEPGDVVEIGCALGGSSIVIASAKSDDRPLRIYDMFGMIPPPSEHDGDDMRARYDDIAAGRAEGLGGGRYYLYEEDLRAVVVANLTAAGYAPDRHAIELIAGPAEETVAEGGPIGFAHIDVDWYRPVLHSLRQTIPNLAPHGTAIVHAYSSWSGCRKAIDDYFDSIGRDGFAFDDSARHLVITRTT